MKSLQPFGMEVSALEGSVTLSIRGLGDAVTERPWLE
jgi:hypothetical protein